MNQNQIMLRQVSSRNSRSKGLKVKKSLQFFLLLAITVWLLYQVKHSYDKKKPYDKNNKPVSISTLKEELTNTPREEILRFGRKVLPHIEEKEEKNDKTKISERDTNTDENYEAEGTAEIAEEAEAEELEKDELEKDEMDADSEETTLLEDEDGGGKDEIQEARERTFHGDNVASAVTHDVNIPWHDDYLDNNNNNNNNNNKEVHLASNSSLTNGTNLVVGNEIKNNTKSETGLVNEFREIITKVNLTNGIVVTLNETIKINSTTNLGSTRDVKEKNDISVVGLSSNDSINTTSVSLNPIEIGDDERNESHIEIMGVNGGDIIFE